MFKYQKLVEYVEFHKNKSNHSKVDGKATYF